MYIKKTMGEGGMYNYTMYNYIYVPVCPHTIQCCSGVCEHGGMLCTYACVLSEM